MADLFWPGDERAGHHFSSASFLRAMVSIEGEWLGRDLELPDDLAGLSRDAEAGGNPVIPLVRMLRDQLGEDAERLHRGFTSQDVVDTALVRMAHAAVLDLRLDLEGIVAELVRLAGQHRDTPMVARTLTQHAVPTTFGFRVAAWLTVVLDAYDALAGCTDACARIANDVLTMSRPGIGELSEGSGGGSSTMPDKANQVLSVLVRRAALTTPQLAATLHLAAAQQVDDRADGGWHADWATLRDLVRRTLVAVSQTADLVAGLRVHPDRMADTLAAAGDAGRQVDRAVARARTLLERDR